MPLKKDTQGDLQRQIANLTKVLEESSKPDIPVRLRKTDNYATIIGATVSVILSMITLLLTCQSEKNNKQIELLSNQLDVLKSVYEPYVNGNAIIENYEQENQKIIYTISFKNHGGHLEELSLI